MPLRIDLVSMIRRIPFVIGVLLFVASLYLAWSYYRISGRVLVYDEQWPRPWPYPDLWLAEALEELDTMFPAPPRTFKIHGEIPRLQLILAVSCAAAFQLSCLFAGPSIWSWAKRNKLPQRARSALAALLVKVQAKKRSMTE